MIEWFLIEPNKVLLQKMKEDRQKIKEEKTLFRDMNRYLMNSPWFQYK